MNEEPVLTVEAEQRRKAAEEFLQTAGWYIGDDRPQTRRVLVELLAQVPESALGTLYGVERRILVIAPRRGTTETVMYSIPPGEPGKVTRFAVLTLDWELELQPWQQAFRNVSLILGKALIELSGKDAGGVSPEAWPEQCASRPN